MARLKGDRLRCRAAASSGRMALSHPRQCQNRATEMRLLLTDDGYVALPCCWPHLRQRGTLAAYAPIEKYDPPARELID